MATVSCFTNNEQASSCSLPSHSNLKAHSSLAAASSSLTSWPMGVDELKSFFMLVHLNIQDLLGSNKKTHAAHNIHAKIDLLKQLYSQTVTPSIICLTKTKLSAHIDSSEIDILINVIALDDKAEASQFSIVTIWMRCL